MNSPENLVMRSQGMETRIYIARDPCELPGHRYHATWDMGHFLCTRCGMRAVCPVCVPQWPDTPLALYVCPKHQPKEQADV